ncbi:MAG: hypothetical protein HY590_07760 [Candidatus Omnitrophica bacterium]|nr:hypothetical protein [Candidatus Omnitrophota bacterium]
MTQKRTSWLFGSGLIFLLLGELSIVLGIASLKVWVTPFCWTGYILIVDTTLYRKRGHSLLQNQPGHFFFTLPLSAGLWLVFEGYNLLLKNWEYRNIPSNPLIAYPGYFWSFATILPALLETNALLEEWGFFKNLRLTPTKISRGALVFSFLLGLVFLIYPLLTKSIYDFPPVWLGFIFLLEPLNYRWGEESLLKKLGMGEGQRLFTLLLTGGVMGILWEFWNFWAEAKWVYHIPDPTGLKIFEMPLLGFLGFFPFAVEFYVMYRFVLILFKPYTPCHFVARETSPRFRFPVLRSPSPKEHGPAALKRPSA